MIRTKIVGVTFSNADGTNRQAIIQRLRNGESLYLRDMSDARFPEAIGIFDRFGQQCGSIKKELALELRGFGDFESFPVRVLQVTGGDGYSFGCNIEIQERSVADEIEESVRFLDSLEQEEDDDDGLIAPAPVRRRSTQARPQARPQPTTPTKHKAPRRKVSKHKKWNIFILCLLLGIFGVHRFYLRKKITGFVYLFTFGLYGVGWVFDLVMIATGHFKDERNLPIV